MTAVTKKPLSKPAERDPLAMITLAALVIAIALVLVRATMMEVVRDGFDLPSGAGATEAISFPGPTTSLVLDLLCFVPAILVLVRRAIDPTYVLRPHWSHIPMALLAAWVLLSVSWSSDKFAALITACDWSAAMAIGWAASQLVRSWSRLRIVLASAVGLLLICLAQGVVYRFFELPESIRYWDETKAETMRMRGWQPDDFVAQQFDRKVRAGEMVAFYKSPNTFAAVTALCALIAAGFALQRWWYSREDAYAAKSLASDGDDAVAPGGTLNYSPPGLNVRSQEDAGLAAILGIPALLALVMIYMAGSRTALAGLVLCAAVFVVLWQVRNWLAAHARLAFVIGGLIVGLGIVAVIAVGVSTGGLVHESLTFRWQYWQGAWKLFLAHPLAGVGWSNFGESYLQYRLPVAAEEIKDPHNFIVKFLTETGLIGAILAIGWLKLSLFESTRPTGPRQPSAAASGGSNVLPTLGAITALYVVARVVAGAPISLLPTELLKLLLFGVLLILAMVLCVIRGKEDFSSDDRPAPLLLWGAIIAVGGFLLHNMVDFALFENGSLMLFMLVLGAILGVRHPSVAGKKPRTWAALTALGLLFIGLLAMVGLVLLPVASAESKAEAADAAAFNRRPAEALNLMREAIVASPVPNSDYAMRAVQFMGRSDPKEILAMIATAIEADPLNTQAWLTSARFRRMLPPTEPGGAPDTIRQDYARVMTLNPADPSLRADYADWLDSVGMRVEAATQYQAALDANSKMDAAEPRRLPKARVAQIEERLKQK